MRQALVFIAFVGLGNWNLDFSWRAADHPSRLFLEDFSDSRACLERVDSILKTMLITLPQGFRDYRYEWHCLPQGMVY